MSDARASKPVLKIDWCTHEAARYAVENWHYSKRMPMPPLVRIGAWEDSAFIGCVLFARGANAQLGRPYGLGQTECAELVRVALTKHKTEVSRIVAIAIRFLRKHSTGLRLLVSYADPAEGHHGGIYQAGGWAYCGRSDPTKVYLHQGRWKHKREVTGGAFGAPCKVSDREFKALPCRSMPGKHRYLFPLDAAMAAQIAPLSKPYPKRPAKSSPSGTTTGEGGALPTAGL
jgi:hypothetical protein